MVPTPTPGLGVTGGGQNFLASKKTKIAKTTSLTHS
jgi:hypothetical protein